jgi:hypothetical protein
MVGNDDKKRNSYACNRDTMRIKSYPAVYEPLIFFPEVVGNTGCPEITEESNQGGYKCQYNKKVTQVTNEIMHHLSALNFLLLV